MVTQSPELQLEEGEQEEVDSEDLPLLVDLIEWKRKKEYDEFWGDLCWVDPESETNG